MQRNSADSTSTQQDSTSTQQDSTDSSQDDGTLILPHGAEFPDARKKTPIGTPIDTRDPSFSTDPLSSPLSASIFFEDVLEPGDSTLSLSTLRPVRVSSESPSKMELERLIQNAMQEGMRTQQASVAALITAQNEKIEALQRTVDAQGKTITELQSAIAVQGAQTSHQVGLEDFKQQVDTHHEKLTLLQGIVTTHHVKIQALTSPASLVVKQESKNIPVKTEVAVADKENQGIPDEEELAHSSGFVPIGILYVGGVVTAEVFNNSLSSSETHLVFRSHAATDDCSASRRLDPALTTKYENLTVGIAEYEMSESLEYPAFLAKGRRYAIKRWQPIKLTPLVKDIRRGKALNFGEQFGLTSDVSDERKVENLVSAPSQFAKEISELKNAAALLEGEMKRNSSMMSYTNNRVFSSANAKLIELNALKDKKRSFLQSLQLAFESKENGRLSKEQILNKVIGQLQPGEIDTIVAAKYTAGRTLALMKKLGYVPPVEKVEKRFGGIFSCCISR